MYSGISGLKNFQTKLDVIGNNIANVNTYGFKKGRTIFKDLISQTVAGASGASDTRGGVNPRQVGLGAQLAAIDTIHSGGSTQFTGNTLDLAISGDGFFQVKDGGEIMYTRAGNFYMDNNGDLVDGDGRYIQGETTQTNTATPPVTTTKIGTINVPITASSMSIGQDGTVYYVDTTAEGKKAIEAAEVIFKPQKEAFEKASKAFDDAKKLYESDPSAAGAETAYQTAKTTFETAKTTFEPQKAAYDKVLAQNKATLQVAGKIQIATFSNPGGLEKTGGNLFRASANSGVAETGFALDQGFGAIESGFLEMSNVDLSEEFTEMIVAQRGFQANTRIITTSDEILQELVNLKR